MADRFRVEWLLSCCERCIIYAKDMNVEKRLAAAEKLPGGRVLVSFERLPQNDVTYCYSFTALVVEAARRRTDEGRLELPEKDQQFAKPQQAYYNQAFSSSLSHPTSVPLLCLCRTACCGLSKLLK